MVIVFMVIIKLFFIVIYGNKIVVLYGNFIYDFYCNWNKIKVMNVQRLLSDDIRTFFLIIGA